MDAKIQKSFEEIKEEILKKAIENDACNSGINDAKNTSNTLELLLVIKKHIRWLIQSKTIDAEWLEECFGTKLLWANHIYTSGQHHIHLDEDKSYGVVTLGRSSATVKTLGSSSATVETWDSSSATVETWDSSSATVKTLGSSSATVETWDSSSATVAFYNSSKLTHSLGSGICPTIKHLTEKKVFVKTSSFEVVQIN